MFWNKKDCLLAVARTVGQDLAKQGDIHWDVGFWERRGNSRIRKRPVQVISQADDKLKTIPNYTKEQIEVCPPRCFD